MDTTKSRLSWLWLFATLNYLYCDVVTLMDPSLLREFLTGNLGSMTISQGFLLGASMLVEIPMAMIVVSRFLSGRWARWSNLIAATVMTLVQGASLFAGSPAAYYLFFSAIEIATTCLIAWLAWRSMATTGLPRFAWLRAVLNS